MKKADLIKKLTDAIDRLDQARNWQHNSQVWDDRDDDLTGTDQSIVDWIEQPLKDIINEL